MTFNFTVFYNVFWKFSANQYLRVNFQKTKNIVYLLLVRLESPYHRSDSNSSTVLTNCQAISTEIGTDSLKI